ncbi:uncharacterized protein LOC143933878 [Lithobates pipiens]
MKSLVLSLLLFFLIGTHGHSIAQEKHDEPARPGAKESLKRVITGIYVIGAELVGMLDSPDTEKIDHLQKRAETIFVDLYNVLFVVGDTIVETCKEVDKEIHEHYPIYRTKAIPFIQEYLNNVIQYVVTLKDEILPYVTKANTEIMKIQLQFLTDMKTLFSGHADKLNSFKEEMHAKIKPLVEQIQQELKAAEKGDHKDLTDEQRQLYKDTLQRMLTYREEDSKKMFEILDKISNKA